MNWTTPVDLKAAWQRRWARGDLARAVVEQAGGPVGGHAVGTPDVARAAAAGLAVPHRTPLRGPDTGEIADRFDAVRDWIATLQALPRVRLEWREIRHRVHGAQRLPVAAWVDTLDDALVLAGRRAEAAQLRTLVAQTRALEPRLLPWLAQRPLQALELAADWSHLLAAAAWFGAHPRPGVYLRQIDVPGLHTKFIEAHRAVLSAWMDLLLPACAIDTRHTGVGGFAARHGFLDKPARVRLRLLDPGLSPGWFAHPTTGLADLTLDADSFAALHLRARHVVVVENEITFLALPPVPDTVALFGAGYGVEAAQALACSGWAAQAQVHYWGDLDTHGFAILARWRARLPHTRSLLMDRPTLMAHRPLWGQEPQPVAHDLPGLDDAEQALYDELRHHHIAPSLRLEQERIGFGWVRRALQALPGLGGVVSAEDRPPASFPAPGRDTAQSPVDGS